MRIIGFLLASFITLSSLPGIASAQEAVPSATPATQSGTHLVFGATARTLPAGEGYVAFTEALLPRFEVGVTDRVSLGAGTVVPYPRAVFLTPKVQLYRSTSTAAAIGVVHLVGAPEFSAGVAYAVLTKDRAPKEDGSAWSFTGGLGIAYARYESDGTTKGGQQPVALVATEFRRSSHSTDIVEAYVLRNGGMVVVAHRHTWTRWWVDGGFVFQIPPTGVAQPAPVVNFGRKF